MKARKTAQKRTLSKSQDNSTTSTVKDSSGGNAKRFKAQATQLKEDLQEEKDLISKKSTSRVNIKNPMILPSLQLELSSNEEEAAETEEKSLEEELDVQVTKCLGLCKKGKNAGKMWQCLKYLPGHKKEGETVKGSFKWLVGGLKKWGTLYRGVVKNENSPNYGLPYSVYKTPLDEFILGTFNFLNKPDES